MLKDMKLYMQNMRDMVKQLDFQLPQNSMLVYDCDFTSFKTIINDIKQKSKQVSCVYRFLLKSSNFILGSDSSVSRGVVDKF